MAPHRDDDGLPARLADTECLTAVLEAAGPIAAARLAAACRRLRGEGGGCGEGDGGHAAEAFWRAACGAVAGERPLGGEASWRSHFARVCGPGVAREARRERLRRGLAQRGLELRTDSALCARYIDFGESEVRGGLNGVIDTMEEMSFFFRATGYPVLRSDLLDEVHERARADARDAFRAGEEDFPDPSSYLEQPGLTEFSEIAKGMALADFVLREYRHTAVEAHPQSPDVAALTERLLRLTPRSLHARVRAACGRAAPTAASDGSDDGGEEGGGWQRLAASPGAALEAWCAERGLGDETPQARRARLRARNQHQRTETHTRLAPHIEALRLFAAAADSADTAAADGENREHVSFPASLSREDRAHLHNLAEQLGLQHESFGEGAGRILVVSRGGTGEETPRPAAFL